MAISDISLTAGMRSNLINLQSTAALLDRTQQRLSTGKRVNSALDDPMAFFTAQGLGQRASDLSALKDSMTQAIQTVKAADAGIKGITKLIESAQGLAKSALATSDAATRAAYATQFDEILGQIDDLAADAGYNGTNLLSATDTLTVNFNEDSSSSLAIAGVDSSSTGLAIAAAVGSWALTASIQTSIGELGTALTTLRGTSSSLSSNLSIVQSRIDFTADMVSTLVGGADNLVLADMNEEGANMLALQTKQSLSTTALSLAAQAAQSVLRLFQ